MQNLLLFVQDYFGYFRLFAFTCVCVCVCVWVRIYVYIYEAAYQFLSKPDFLRVLNTNGCIIFQMVFLYLLKLSNVFSPIFC